MCAAEVCGGAGAARPGQGGPSPVRETIAFKAELEVEDGALEELRVEELYDAVVDAVKKVIKTVRIIVDDEVCEPVSNEYSSGVGFHHYANECCLGRLADGRHVHVSGCYGHVGNKTYARVDEVVLEMEELEGAGT
jgi:hypothetical protein